jgi:hypothetical protein
VLVGPRRRDVVGINDLPNAERVLGDAQRLGNERTRITAGVGSELTHVLTFSMHAHTPTTTTTTNFMMWCCMSDQRAQIDTIRPVFGKVVQMNTGRRACRASQQSPTHRRWRA